MAGEVPWGGGGGVQDFRLAWPLLPSQQHQIFNPNIPFDQCNEMTHTPRFDPVVIGKCWARLWPGRDGFRACGSTFSEDQVSPQRTRSFFKAKIGSPYLLPILHWAVVSDRVTYWACSSSRDSTRQRSNSLVNIRKEGTKANARPSPGFYSSTSVSLDYSIPAIKSSNPSKTYQSRPSYGPRALLCGLILEKNCTERT